MYCTRLAENTGRKKLPDRHHCTIYRALSSQLRHLSTVGKKNLLRSNTSSTCPDNMVHIRPTNSWDRFGSLGHPCKFQRVLRLGSVTAQHSSSGRQPNFAELNRGRHLYLAGRPSRWALAHILVNIKSAEESAIAVTCHYPTIHFSSILLHLVVVQCRNWKHVQC